MLSPSPTQSPPPPPPVQKTNLKVRPGQTPAARFVKALFRPFIKLLYYTIMLIRKNGLVSIGVIVLLLVSISATLYFTTGRLPLGIADDPYNFHINGGDGGGTKVKDWLYALRDGDSTQLRYLEKDMSQPTDPQQLISTYSPSKTHLTWKAEHVLGVYQQDDTTVDSFVQVDLSANGPGGETTGIVIWHFITVSSNGQDLLLSATVIENRPKLG